MSSIRFPPYFTLMELGNFFDDGQPQPTPFNFMNCFTSFKWVENLLTIIRIQTNPIILDGKDMSFIRAILFFVDSIDSNTPV